MLIRFVIGSFVIAALFLLYGWWKAQGAVIDLGTADTAGEIAAIQHLPGSEGDVAVLLKEDGSIMSAPNHAATIVDRDLAWRPDGNRLLFASDRDKRVFNIWMWKPESNEISRMTTGTRGQGQPNYPVNNPIVGNQTALMISAGIVVEFDPIQQTRRQVLPFHNKEVPMSSASEEGGGGQDSQFTGDYGKLGTSFKTARWAKGKKYIAAVMRREDGEVLVLQNLEPQTDEEARPIAVVAGDKVQFDVDPVSARIVYTVQNFQYVEITRNMQDEQGKLKPEFQKKPFSHMVGLIDLDNPHAQDKTGVIAATNDDKHSFGMPAISPDGSSVLVPVGPYVSGALEPAELDSLPCHPLGIRGMTHLIRGPADEPSWSPDGRQFTFVMRNSSGKRAIFTANKDASNMADKTGAKGDFSFPKFSPQTKKN